MCIRDRYKGGAPLATDLLGGQIDLAVMAMPGAMPHVRAGLSLIHISEPTRPY